MSQDHQSPEPPHRLWKYLKVHRFLEFIRDERLYFAAATQFSDPFEGALAVMPPGFPVDPRYSDYDPVENAFKELKRLSKITCWHIEDHESDAMWQLYSGEGKGIAITTSTERLSAAFKPFRLRPSYGEENIASGCVRYVDLLAERLQLNGSERFFYKHNAFSWEREFRQMISLRMAEEFGADVPNDGIYVECDLSSLVDEIYLGPSLDEETQESVRKACEAKGLADKVKLSCLLGRPRYV
jgi:hypothetical protein